MRCPDLGEPMRRREFIRAIAAGTLVCPLATRAQQSERTRRIGVLMGYPEGDKQAQAGVIALQKGLQSVGWIEGRNV